MRRREFIALISAAAAAWPAAAHAQQAVKIWRIGFFSSVQYRLNVAGEPTESWFNAFRERMRELGYTERKDLIIEWRFPARPEECPELAMQLVRLKVDVIVAVGWPAIKAATEATSVIPIVIGYLSDPVALGVVSGLARPGGNVTGLTSAMTDIITKHLELLMDLLPKLSRVGVLVNPNNATGPLLLNQLRGPAERARIALVKVEAQNAEDIFRGFSDMQSEHVGAVILLIDPEFTVQRRQIAELALKHMLPTIYGIGEYAEAGGLMSYGDSLPIFYRGAATYVDKIIKGAKPADLPIEHPI